MAKTAFGYSANEVMQQLGNQQGGYGQPQGGYGQPQGGYGQPPQDPRAHSPSQPGYGGLAPPGAANAATMMVPPGVNPPGANAFAQTLPQGQTYQQGGGGYGQPQGGYGQPQGGYGQPQGGYGGGPGYGQPGGGYGQPSGMTGVPPQQGGMGIHSQNQPTPNPLPIGGGPQYSSRAAGRPIEPWKDSIKLWMIVWGAAALVAFATPVHVDPMGFNWDLIIDGPGKMKIIPLVWATVGLVSLLVGVLAMDSLARGIIATGLGLAGILTPIIVLGVMPPWQILLQLIATLVLVPGLLVRHEYVESMLARILITVGVVCFLVPYFIPDHGSIPLVDIFKGLIDAPGKHKIEPILLMVHIVLVVLTLLAWMPGPATGMGKPLAWALILFPVGEFVIQLLVRGGIGDVITKMPGALLAWVPGVTYAVLLGYGGATVIGKQLE